MEKTVGFIIAVVVVVLLVSLIGIYNTLVKSRQRVRNSWSQVDVQLQRRFDMIPNLIEIVKGYMKHEEEVLTKVVQLRTAWGNSESITQKAELGNELGGMIHKIFAVSEQYPELKANESFTVLQGQINETESKIAFSRQFYNDSVTIYNTKLEMFPCNLVAGMFHFKPETLFNLESDEIRKNVEVKF